MARLAAKPSTRGRRARRIPALRSNIPPLIEGLKPMTDREIEAAIGIPESKPTLNRDIDIGIVAAVVQSHVNAMKLAMAAYWASDREDETNARDHVEAAIIAYNKDMGE